VRYTLDRACAFFFFEDCTNGSRRWVRCLYTIFGLETGSEKTSGCAELSSAGPSAPPCVYRSTPASGPLVSEFKKKTERHPINDEFNDEVVPISFL